MFLTPPDLAVSLPPPTLLLLWQPFPKTAVSPLPSQALEQPPSRQGVGASGGPTHSHGADGRHGLVDK